MTHPPYGKPTRPSGDGHRFSLKTIVLSIVGLGVVLAVLIITGIPAFSRYARQKHIDRENERYRVEASQQNISNLNTGNEFRPRNTDRIAGDSYAFQIPEGNFVYLPDNAKGIRQFLYRIDDIVPDSKGNVTIYPGDNITASLNIDSLVNISDDSEFSPVIMRVKGHPDLSAIATSINIDTYNRKDGDIDYHSYIAFVKGYLLTSGDFHNKEMPPSRIKSINSVHDSLYTFTLHADDFAPIAKDSKGVKEFVSHIDNIVPDKSGKVMIGSSNARAWLNIDSLIRNGSSDAFQPVFLKVKGNSNVVLLTELSINSLKHNNKDGDYKSYNAMAKGYIFSKETITQE